MSDRSGGRTGAPPGGSAATGGADFGTVATFAPSLSGLERGLNGFSLARRLRRAALRDCGQRCVYCATHLDDRTATLDHVFPLARGGAHDPGNLVVACGPCNRLKGDLFPFEFFARHPWAGANFVRYARAVHRALKRGARRAVSLAFARDDAVAA